MGRIGPYFLFGYKLTKYCGDSSPFIGKLLHNVIIYFSWVLINPLL